MASNRSRSNRSVGNKLNNLDSRVSRGEKGTNNPHLSPDVIEEQHLTDGSVAEAKLAERSVTETKIARGAVGTEHLGVVNAVTADSGLTLKPGPDGGFIVIDGPEYVAPAAGSGDLYALAFNELNQVVVSTTGVGGGDGIAAMPAGSIQPWPSNAIPDGWLLCDGSAVSRTTYSDLFNVLAPVQNAQFTVRVLQAPNTGSGYVYVFESGTLITGTPFQLKGSVPPNVGTYHRCLFTPFDIGGGQGTKYVLNSASGFIFTNSGLLNQAFTLVADRTFPYGFVESTDTFNLPNIKGRTIVGRDASQTEFDVLGETGGAKTHTLTTAEIPAHSHTGTTNTDGSHRHWISGAAYDDGNMSTSGSSNSQDYGLAADAGGYTQYDRDSGYGRYSSYSGSTHAHAFTTGTNGGSGGAHNNLQPYIVLNYIIKHMVADGMQGPQGIQGEPGDAATVAVGTTTTGIAGSLAAVTNAGTTSAAVLNFTIPRGDTGATGSTGPQGPSGTIAVGSTSTGAEGTDAAVTNSGTSTNAVLEFVIPRGNAATVAVGTTTTGDPGTNASVTNSGDGHAAIFDFVIPEGIGATADVGTVITVTEDDDATVTNSGTTVDAVFDFEIPRGKTGDSAGVQFTFSTDTTDSDPTNGKLKFDSATPASITYLYIDNVDADGADHTAWYDQWDTSTSQTKGTIYVGEYRSDSVAVFQVTNIVTAATGYYKVPVEYVSGNLPAADAVCYVTFAAQGNIGNETPYGGDAGQILAKASNDDYDFVWIDNYADWTSQVKHKVKAAESLTIGQAVYVSDSDGTNMLVSKASNATEATSSKTMGLIMQNLATNGQGYVITEGLLSGLDTTLATQGDPVWLGTDGNLLYGVLNKPVAPAHMVFIGIVTRVNLNNGEIFVKVQNGLELDELHNVSITDPQDGQALAYDDATGLWINTTPATTLDSLTDVELTAPLLDGQALTYDLATETWVNATPATTLDSLTDVELTEPLEDGQALTYDLATDTWINATPASTLDSLTDVDISTVAPVDGDILTYDATAEEWIAQSLGNAAMPSGSVMAWGGATAPSGWLLCQGQEVSRTEYASLFSAIGTAFGAGDTVMTFNLPDLRGRTPFGRDAGQTEFDVLGEMGGSKTTSFPTQGDGTSTGNGLAYSESMSSVDDGTYNNLPPYQTLNYIIKWASGETPTDESQLTDRVSDLEEIVQTAYNQMPAGAIMAWASAVAPSNWLICDGSAVSRTLYASLYATIGDSYGAGDGTTTFNLPNLKGRVPVGKDGANSAFDVIGETGGDQTPSKDGTGTATGYGLLYGSSMDVADTTPTNMPPYQVVNYVIKATAGTTESDSALTDRVSTLESTVGSMFPAGTILASALTTAPAGWAICDGAAVSRSTYASLFAAIGTTYGTGDNVTTFNLPNLKGKTIFGVDSAQTEFDTVGESGGNKLIQGHGSGTATGYGLTYSESVLTATGLTTAQNLPPYTALNYLIRLVTATPDAESEFVTRLGELETFVENGGNESPAGSIMAWGALTAPTNWLLCDGSVVLKADWPSLYAAIGNQYATGGETELQFRLPNLKGRVAVGRDASQAEFDTLGETGGAKTHTLSASEMPSHTHTFSGTSSTDGAHTHTVHETWSDANTTHNHGSSGGYVAQGQTVARGGTYDDPNVVVSAGSHSHTYSGTTSSTGSGGAHNNLQPYIVLNYIIKATSGVSTTDSVLVERVGQLELEAEFPIKLNLQTLTANYTIPVGYNGLSAGPIVIADGVTITIPDGSAWSVV